MANLETVMRDKHLTIPEIKGIISTLWAARLLGWVPRDIEWLGYKRLTEIVAENTRRPIDAGPMLKPGYRNLSPTELLKYRFALDQIEAV